MPIFWRKQVLLAKIETTYGTDPTLTGALNAILAKNVTISPMDGSDVSRDLVTPYFGNQPSIPAELHVTINFDTELAGSGTPGTVPAWGVLLRACGCAEVITASTSVTYTPITDNIESAYLKFWVGGTLHAIKGVRGSVKLTANAQGIPMMSWSFMGLWVAPAEAAAAVPTLTAFKKPVMVNKTNTPTFNVNSVSLVMRNFSFDLNNQVEPRMLVGTESVLITDHREQIEFTCESVPVTTLDPYGLANAQTTVPVSLVHGTTAGNIITLSAPTSEFKRPTGYQQNQGVAEWPLSMLALPNAGNDQFSLALT
ncbi:phage tail tube protein [Bradyrhizobium ontarionense]|uniref:Phage tail tube protein n=1 Tax=Bradyrhizobium ontarionense TaxID=2898149 RepID=A0ABY3RF12_9BRAD|nr:phage tail tube protein [Bradyrhizobium sp. A19]UFZ05456.1 phage tail tube protein [Bradyrhizobium sp. A19]